MIRPAFSEHKSKLFVLIVALFTTIGLPLIIQDLYSLSSAWNTMWQPLFILSNAIISYYMYSAQKWKISALLLLALTAFSIEMYRDVHYFVAVLFFLSCVRPIILNKKLRVYSIPYILSLFLFVWDIMIAEIISILVLLLYHGHLLYLAWSINNKRHRR